MAIPPGAYDLAPLIPVVGILVFGFLKALNGPVGQAMSDRLRGTAQPNPHDAELLADTLHEVEQLNRRVLEVEERLDFTERLLARAEPPREEAELPTPV